MCFLCSCIIIGCFRNESKHRKTNITTDEQKIATHDENKNENHAIAVSFFLRFFLTSFFSFHLRFVLRLCRCFSAPNASFFRFSCIIYVVVFLLKNLPAVCRRPSCIFALHIHLGLLGAHHMCRRQRLQTNIVFLRARYAINCSRFQFILFSSSLRNAIAWALRYVRRRRQWRGVDGGVTRFIMDIPE